MALKFTTHVSSRTFLASSVFLCIYFLFCEIDTARASCDPPSFALCHYVIISGDDPKFSFYWSRRQKAGYIVNKSEIHRGGNPRTWGDSWAHDFITCGGARDATSVAEAVQTIASKEECKNMEDCPDPRGCRRVQACEVQRVNSADSKNWEIKEDTCAELKSCDDIVSCNEAYFSDPKNDGYIE